VKTSNIIKIGTLVVLILGLLAAYFLTPLSEYVSVDKITELTSDVPQTIPVALIFLGIFFVGGALLAPIPLIAFAVSLVFDVWFSVLIAIPGFLLASLSGYGVGRLIGTDSFGKTVTKHVDSIRDKVDDKGAWSILALRLAPTPPFTITSMISGAIKINIVKYAAGSTLGIAPLGLSAIFFGKGAIEMMKDPSGLAASSIIAAIILFSVFKIMKDKQKSANE
jgi:uncharacterized membrane protein YdjX (TVP38/TMEM64 family)